MQRDVNELSLEEENKLNKRQKIQLVEYNPKVGTYNQLPTGISLAKYL